MEGVGGRGVGVDMAIGQWYCRDSIDPPREDTNNATLHCLHHELHLRTLKCIITSVCWTSESLLRKSKRNPDRTGFWDIFAPPIQTLCVGTIPLFSIQVLESYLYLLQSGFSATVNSTTVYTIKRQSIYILYNCIKFNNQYVRVLSCSWTFWE